MNDPRNIHDDPRLTAYALGELDLEEAREVRAAIAGDAAAQQYVQDVRAMAGMLRDELGAESSAAGAMNDQQRSAVRAAATRAGVGPRRLVLGVSFALAAMVLLAAGATLVLVLNEPERPDEMFALYDAQDAVPQSGPQGRSAIVATDRSESDSDRQANPRIHLSATPNSTRPLGEWYDDQAKLSGQVATEAELLDLKRRGDRPQLAEGLDRYDRDYLLPTEGRQNFGSIAGKPEEAAGTTEWSMPSQSQLDRQLERRQDILRRTGQRDVALVPRRADDLGSGGAQVETFYLGEQLSTAEVATRGRESRTQPVPMPGLRVPDLVVPQALQAESAPAAPAPARPGDELMLGLRLLTEPNVEDPASREQYVPIVDNAFQRATAEPLSTFSIDVDTASYANVRRFLKEGSLPPRDAVRIEELLNYFTYDYAPPAGEQPFAAHVEVGAAPWDPSHRLVRIGLKGREIAAESRPPGNLVFLLDVSGSMKSADKLPLLKEGMSMLAAQLRPEDRVAIVTYAGDSRVALNSTSGDQHEEIRAAIDQLQAGGSTNGGAGIAQAYQIAARHFVPGGVNRVILATDGDFNVGTTSMNALQNMIEGKRTTGVFLSVLGFGTGNLKDGTMEMLANKGNGNYAYIDDVREARKVLVQQMNSTLITIAKDVKVQVEFNPALVESYRLIGYENRVLAAEDFNDDRKDAGEIGAGHTVTALYEVVPAKGLGKPAEQPAIAGVDPLRYRRAGAAELSDAAMSDELLTVKLRYKQPESEQSTLLEFPVRNTVRGQASADLNFAAAVAGFGMILRDSPHKGTATWPMVLELAAAGQGRDEGGWRAEFIELVRTAKNIAER